MTVLVAGNALRGADGKGEAAVKHPPPEPWQVAGIRSALGDPSPQVRAEAAFYCGARHWSRQCLKMEDLMPLLQDADLRVKITALEGLTDMGPEFTPAAAAVLTPMLLLEEDVDGLNEHAFGALARLGPEAAPLVVPRVLPLLEKADAPLKMRIVNILLQIGPGAAPYAQALLPLLQDSNLELRDRTLITLQRMEIGETKPPNAAEIAPAVARALLPLLKDADSNTRSAVQAVLASLGMEAAPLVLPALLPLLDDDDMRTEAQWYLSHLGKTAAPAVVPLLLPRLRHAEGRVRSLAVIILHYMGPAAAPYAAEIRPLLKDTDDLARCFAASTLAELGAGSTTYFNDLLPMLQDPDPGIQSAAMSALAGMGPKTAPQVVKALLPLLHSTDRKMPWEMEKAFTELRNEALPMADVLLPELRKAPAQMKIAIIGALAPVQADATPYIELLRPYLQDPDSDLRASAAKVLAGIGTGPEAAAFIQKEMLPLLNDPDKRVKTAVVQGLSRTANVPLLLPLLYDEDSDLRRSALESFQHLGAEAAPYARDFLPLVEGRGTLREESVFDLFKSMGAPAAPVLLPALVPLLAKPARSERRYVFGVFDALGNLSSDLDWQCAALAAAHTTHSGKTEAETQKIEREQSALRFHLHLWSGHAPDLLLSVRWLGRPANDPMPAQGLSAAEQQAVLSMLLKLWPHSLPHPALRREMAGRIAQVARGITTAPEEKVAELLKKLEAELKADAVADSQEASAKAREAVQSVLAGK